MVSCDSHVTCSGKSCDGHVTCSGKSCDGHVTCSGKSCDGHVICSGKSHALGCVSCYMQGFTLLLDTCLISVRSQKQLTRRYVS